MSSGEYIVEIPICVYKHEKFIAQTIEGILAQQTEYKFRMVIGEDRSPDGSREIIKKYLDRYPDKMNVFFREQNVGAFENSMLLLRECQAKYIALCDGDDYWTDPHKLQRQISFLEANPDYSIAFHRVSELYPDGKIHLSYLNESPNEETYTFSDLATNGNFLHTPSVVYRNHLKGALPAWFKNAPVGDYVLHMLHAQYGKLRYFPQPMAVYRRHEGGMWSGYAREKAIEMRKRWLTMLELMMKEFPAVQAELQYQYSRNSFSLGKEYESAGDVENARAAYKQAVKFDSDLLFDLEYKKAAAPAVESGLKSLVRRSIKRIFRR